MTDVSFWPASLPPALAEFPDQVAKAFGGSSAVIGGISALDSVEGPLVIILSGTDLTGTDLLSTLDRVISGRAAPTTIVIGDGWIGTDGPDLVSALTGAAAVSLTRSIAARRAPTGRVNIVCVPERLLGAAGSQRGPLTLDIDSAAIADVVAFIIGDESSYIDGQVLYADGGRQLFSSLTA
jgi:hypothetical protein